MRTIKFSTCAGIILSAIATSAVADYEPYGSPYGSAKFGWSQEKATHIQNTAVTGDTTHAPTKSSFQHSPYVYGGALGYQYTGLLAPIRMEGEYLYRGSVDYNANPILYSGTTSMTSNLYTQTILGNLYIDIPITNMFQLFIGGGGGLANTRTHMTRTNLTAPHTVVKNTTDRDSVSWMATAGMSIKPVEWIAFEASYRYSDLGSVRWGVDTNELTSNNYSANEVMVGFRLIAPDGKKKPQQRYQATEYTPATPPVIMVKEQNYPQDNTNERTRRQHAAGNPKVDK